MSTVILQTIEWDNCFSFGKDNIVYLNKEPLTQIIGPNGFGKSSIPLIIEEALFNKNSKGVKKGDIANRLLNDPYSITTTFSIDNDEYKVIVSRGKVSVKVSLYKNGEDISSHTATATFKEIEDLLGLEFKVFQQLVYQSTNSSLQFLTATDTNRKKFLIDLFDLSEYVALFEKFKEAIKSLSLDISKLEGRVSVITNWIDENSNLDTEKLEYKNIPDVPDLSSRISEISKELESNKSLNSKIKINNKLKQELAKIDINRLREQFACLEFRSYDSLQERIGNIQANKKAAETVINKLTAVGDKCPTCLQDVDKEFHSDLLNTNTSIVDECSEEIASINKAIDDIKKNNILFKSLEKDIEEWETNNSKINKNISDTLIDTTDLEKELADVNTQLSSINDSIKKIQAYNASVDKHNSRIDIVLEQAEKFDLEMKEAVDKLNTLKLRAKHLEVLKTAFSTNGLIAYKLENLVKDLEDCTNKYLAELSDGRFTIEFSISSDKLNVIVTDNGKEISISSPSAGEMARINIATLLAIRQLMSSISKSTINVLFLDEVISVLDDYGREKLVELLLNIDGLNSFLVSHSWTHPLVDKLEVKKDNGISWIEHG